VVVVCVVGRAAARLFDVRLIGETSQAVHERHGMTDQEYGDCR
jgi:hypothetical protein